MNHKFSSLQYGKTQEFAARIAEEIAKLWDKAIRQVLVNQGIMQEGFDPKEHVETLSAKGQFLIYPDGSKEFRWNEKALLIGKWINGKISNGYEIKPVI